MVCNRTTRGQRCPQCLAETQPQVPAYFYPPEEEKSEAHLSETEMKGLKKKYEEAVKEIRDYDETVNSLEIFISEKEAQMS